MSNDLDTWIVGISVWCEQCEDFVHVEMDREANHAIHRCKHGEFRIVLDPEKIGEGDSKYRQ